MNIYRHFDGGIKRTSRIGLCAEGWGWGGQWAGKRKGRRQHWGWDWVSQEIVVVYFFSRDRQCDPAEKNTGIQRSFSLGLSLTSYLTTQTPFLQHCKMKQVKRKWIKCWTTVVSRGFRINFQQAVRNMQWGSGAQEKGSSERTENHQHRRDG